MPSQEQSNRGASRDRRSFQDIARLAGPPSSEKASERGSASRVRRVDASSARASNPDDSGLIDLQALASSEPGAVDRASVTPLAPSVAGAPGAEPVSAGPVSSAAVSQPLSAPVVSEARPATPAAPAVSGYRGAPATLRSAAPPPVKNALAGRIAATAGLLAVAAGAFLAVRAFEKPAPVASEPDRVEAAPLPPKAAAPAATVAPQEKTAAAPVAPSSPVASKDDGDKGVDPSSLPAAPAATAAAAKSAAPATPLAQAKKSAAPAAKADKGESKIAAAPASKKDEIPAALQAAMAADTSAAPAGPLGDAIKQAAAPAAKDETPTAAAQAVAPTASVPTRPSQGALTGALGAVLGDARACLGPDDPVSHAHVVFGSSGAVQSIEVSGFAAGKPVEACIKAALGKARVPPFAEASYGATVTVRP